MKRIRTFITLCLLAFGMAAVAQQPALIPVLSSVDWASGTYALPSKQITIGCGSAQLRPAADYLAALLARPTGCQVKVNDKGKGHIRLSMAGQGVAGGYRLRVDAQGVAITGNDYRGVINGIATLRQLFPDDIETRRAVGRRQWALPYVSIADQPRFEWRGMELDCSRHFFSVDEVKELLDVLALYKINKFHWHLTDDQGWRVEIKKYPLLTQRGGWRTFNDQDSVCMRRAVAEDNPDFNLPADRIRTNERGQQEYGGFYTQQQVRDIVTYARTRGIDVIPEIDMPGHSLAAIANYDGLSCFPQTGWGTVFTTPLCPGKDKMIRFCQDVWSEVFDLFPYEYVHIGGDEVDMKNWKQCPDCQKRMESHRLKTESQLQSWFNHEMEQFFNRHGRTMIGWDEIIEGGLGATSTVMWWRTWAPDAMKQTTSHGNKFICTPNVPFYLDYDEGGKSLKSLYAFNPQPDKLTDAEKALVLGVQGNLWTEWVPSRNRMMYMAFPRMLAVAELGWSKPEKMTFEDFNRRLITHYTRLRKLGVTYRLPDLTGFHTTNVFTGDRGTVSVGCQDPHAVIRYTTDGTLPNERSQRYTGPFEIDRSTDFIFRTFAADGRKDAFVKASYRKETPAEAVEVADLAEGLNAEWHEYTGADCAGIEAAPVNGCYIVNDVVIPDSVKGNIGLIITGYIQVPEDGIYTFALLSDDGSTLKIDHQMVVDNDGEHSPREIIGQHAMKAGLHPIEVKYFDHNGGQLRLRVYNAQGDEVRVSYWGAAKP